MRVRHLFTLALSLLIPAVTFAGHETPSYIDGCQSVDGRYTITAKWAKDPGKNKNVHGPFEWEFTWTDTKEKKSNTFAAKGLQKGQIHANMYIAPDGETFALFNHVTMYCETSHMHGPPDMRAAWEGKTTFPDRSEFTNRVIVYKKDGSVIKTIGAKDIMTADEWVSVVPFFNRVHWLKEYDGLGLKTTPRMGYALHRISPDYTVLEVTIVPVRSAKDKSGRKVRISLTDGTILDPKDWPTDKSKVPVRPFVGSDGKDIEGANRDYFVPSLDPVRVEGKFATPKEK